MSANERCGYAVNNAVDVIGAADPDAADAEIIDVITEFANRTLAPHANRIDRRGIGRPHLDELASTGAFALPFPAEVGGLAASVGVVREVTELIAGACGTTWFCFAQHRSPTKAVLQSENSALRERWGVSMVSGRSIAGIAFAHLRRPTQRFWIRDNGRSFSLHGSLDWVTTWPLADVVLIEGYLQNEAGVQEDEIVSILIEPPKIDLALSNHIDHDDLQAGPSLSLAAMAGTQTWPVSFIDYRVSTDQLVSRKSADTWLHENSLISADANPAAFGMARASINEMTTLAAETDQPHVERAAASLAEQLRDVRDRAYLAADQAAADAQVAADTIGSRTLLRAEVCDLNLRAATALVTASGGAGMMLSSNAQRRAREALFLLVQGQTADMRVESLARIAR